MTSNSLPSRLGSCSSAKRPLSTCLALAFCLPLAAQQTPDVLDPPVPDPVKGWADSAPLTPAEREMMRTQRPPHWPLPGAAIGAGEPAPSAVSEARPGWRDRVVYDRVDGGPIWAAGAAYKASFGPDGFEYVPFLGADAPRNYPVRFTLRAVRIGGRALPLATATATREGDTITIARGAVRERYDCRLENVEQTLVVDSALPGDVELELAVATELVADTSAGIRFTNERGGVGFGEASVVTAAGSEPVPSVLVGDAVHIRVPAALRGPGPLVIDPLVFTITGTSFGTQSSSQPDVAYDAAAHQFLVAWEYQYSATDFDIYCEFRNDDGVLIAGSFAAIDVSTADHRVPRVADLAAYSRFLVVSQRYEQNRWQIYGRLRLAGSFPHPIVFPISDPAGLGQCTNPDIGGDPGSGDRWLVVWQRELNATTINIHTRTVFADTSLGNLTAIVNTANAIHSLPSVSQSNGNGLTPSPSWMVVYQYRYSSTDWDIYGAAVSLTGILVTSHAPIDTSTLSDLVPTVSSPLTDHPGTVPGFFVTYERQGPYEARGRIVSPSLANAFVNGITPLSLTQNFGLGPFWVRAESDGCRIAVVTGAATITVATLALNGGALSLHEAPVPLILVPDSPRIASARSGGGRRTRYCIAYADVINPQSVIRAVTYDGRQPGNDVVRRQLGCTSFHIDPTGHPYLGETFTCSLSNLPSGLYGIVEGLSQPASTILCAPCPIGVNLAGPVANFLLAGSANQAIPCSPGLVGVTLSMQGYAFFSALSCPSGVIFSDAIDFTIR
ncbi:MAG: hypothetical protein U1E73_07080 [Planctomycetota bacterium]